MTSLKFIIILLLVSILNGVANADQPITIGLLPGGNPGMVEKESLLLAEKLQQKINRPIQIYISKNYTAMIEAIKAAKVDFAILSSLTFVVADEQSDIKVLLKKTWNNGPFYYSAVVVPAKSKIKKLDDLKGKRIAFVDEKSSSGYMYPSVAMQKAGLTEAKFKKVYYSGNHAKSIEMLEKAEVDAVAVFADDEKAKQGAWNRFSKDKKFKFRPIWVSDPIPNDPVVVRKKFYEENAKLTHEMMFSIIEVKNESGDSLSEVLGTSELMPATSKQYDPVRDMYKIFKMSLKL